MAFEHIAKALADTHAVKLTVKVSPPQGFSQARLDMVLKDKDGQVLRPMWLGTKPNLDEWGDIVAQLVQFLVESGFQIISQDDRITELERPLTRSDEMTIHECLNQIFEASLPTKLRVLQSARIYELDINGEIVLLGNLKNEDIDAMNRWLESHGFTKVNTVVEDFRYGEFTHYYERP